MHMQEWPDGAHAEEIAAFGAVGQHGSFTRAAAALAKDASLVSRRVAALERRLGVRLFERSTRRVALTEAGAALHARVMNVFGTLSEAEAEASALGAEPRGLLRLALPATFGRLWIAPMLPDFLTAYPQVRVDAEFSDRFTDLVGEGFDAAVRIGSMPDTRLVARRLAPHRRILCAAPAYLERAGAPSHASDLESHACLGFTGLTTYPNWRLTKNGRTTVVRTQGPLVSNESETLIASVVAGHGVMLCADWLVGREIAAGRLIPILSDWSFEEDGAIQAVLPSGRHVPMKARVFVDWIAGRLSPTTPWAMRSLVGSP